MTGYCTLDELKPLTGTTISDADLTAIIEDASREVAAYLAPLGLTASADIPAVKSATLKYAQAGVRLRDLMDDNKPRTAQQGADIVIASLRAAGLALLDQHIHAAQAQAANRISYLKKVNR